MVREFKQIKIIIDEADSILLAIHENPDGDGIGAMLALGCYLIKEGKRVYFFSIDEVPEGFKFLPGCENVKNQLPQTDFDVLLGLDYGDFRRLGLDEFKAKIGRIISIDHHTLNDQRGDVVLVDTEYSSTSEILYHYFKNLGVAIDRNIATCLLTGIFFDTGGFRHSNTTPRVLNIAKELLNKGASLNKISKAYFGSKTMPALKLWALALERMKKDTDSGMVFSFADYQDLVKCGAKPDDLDGLSSIINTVPDSKFALFLSEKVPKIIDGSLRSEPFKGVDVSLIAKDLGGGGHKYASGFKKKGDINKVLKKVYKVVRD